MTVREFLSLGASMLACCLVWTRHRASAQHATTQPVVRIAELEIDLAQLESYKTDLREEIETSIRVEPGVLALYAVSIKGRPASIRIFEMYSSDADYRAHLETPHFLKYKAGTQGMVKSLQLIETDPVALGANRALRAL